MDIEKNDSVKIDSFDIDEIDLKSLFRVLWDSKVVIAFITSVFAIFSVFYSLSLNDIYKSEATLFIEGSSNDLSLGGLSGLASIAGINVPAGNVDKKQLTSLPGLRGYSMGILLLHASQLIRFVLQKFFRTAVRRH